MRMMLESYKWYLEGQEFFFLQVYAQSTHFQEQIWMLNNTYFNDKNNVTLRYHNVILPILVSQGTDWK